MDRNNPLSLLRSKLCLFPFFSQSVYTLAWFHAFVNYTPINELDYYTGNVFILRKRLRHGRDHQHRRLLLSPPTMPQKTKENGIRTKQLEHETNMNVIEPTTFALLSPTAQLVRSGKESTPASATHLRHPSIVAI